jgi:hypothetical protein
MNTHLLQIANFILLWPKNYACLHEYHTIRQRRIQVNLTYSVSQSNGSYVVLSSFIYRTLLAEDYSSEQKYYYRHVKLFLLEMLKLSTINIQTTYNAKKQNVTMWFQYTLYVENNVAHHLLSLLVSPSHMQLVLKS